MINLLPGSEKERIYKNLLARQIRSLSVLAVTILVGSSIFILNTMVFLKVQSKELKQNLSVESLDAETRQADSLEETIKKLNVRLAKYRELDRTKFHCWMSFTICRKLFLLAAI